MKRRVAILERLGKNLTKEATILDFGCGAGRTVYSLLDQGYINAVGYDPKNYLELRDPKDVSLFTVGNANGRLPFEDNSFDLIISEEVLEHVKDQVEVLRELHRIMRPGGVALHVFPARYNLIEGHMYVPLGGFFAHRWWYQLWAMLGVRNEFQKGLSINETADRNSFYFVEGLNYVPNSFYTVVWQQLGYQWKWFDQEYYDTSERPIGRLVGKLNRLLPIIGWAIRTFGTRRVFLRK